MESMTVHCMVRNEPFVYYAVKSVYDYVSKILLYDTGSYDAHTIEDIHTLLAEDAANKITFKQVPIEVDETRWTDKGGDSMNYRKMAVKNKGKKGKWYCRKKMIDDTKTEHFMILDGDEVHYKVGMEKIAHYVKHWPKGKVCGRVPLLWFTDLKHTFKQSHSGRIFLTSEIGMTKRSPSEMHTYRGKPIGGASPCAFTVSGMKPYAHFEVLLKPWRRNVRKGLWQVFTGELPEVMQENDFYIERFLNENSNK